MRKQIIVAVVFLALCGCGDGEGAKTPVKLEDVPAPAMKVAQEKLPGIKFHEAYRKKDGTYEIRGKEKTGKVREVEVKADGTFVALE
jgi:hypothetical protein